jgi:hypothetical protein
MDILIGELIKFLWLWLICFLVAAPLCWFRQWVLTPECERSTSQCHTRNDQT